MADNCLSVGMKAPNFNAQTTFGTVKMSDYAGQWLIFFSHPGDFTPVCTTEFIAFSQAYPRFEELGASLMGLSVDSNPSHLDWVDTIQELTGITVPFPLIADRSGEIARLYGMLTPSSDYTETVRDVFFIDPNQTIRAILSYPAANGRSIPEIIRLLQALQTTDEYSVLTPANWIPGQPVLVPAAKTYDELVIRKTNAAELGLHCVDWFLCYKEI